MGQPEAKGDLPAKATAGPVSLLRYALPEVAQNWASQDWSDPGPTSCSLSSCPWEHLPLVHPPDRNMVSQSSLQDHWQRGENGLLCADNGKRPAEADKGVWEGGTVGGRKEWERGAIEEAQDWVDPWRLMDISPGQQNQYFLIPRRPPVASLPSVGISASCANTAVLPHRI